jgi:hypothetical protein
MPRKFRECPEIRAGTLAQKVLLRELLVVFRVTVKVMLVLLLLLLLLLPELLVLVLVVLLLPAPAKSG